MENEKQKRFVFIIYILIAPLFIYSQRDLTYPSSVNITRNDYDIIGNVKSYKYISRTEFNKDGGIEKIVRPDTSYTQDINDSDKTYYFLKIKEEDLYFNNKGVLEKRYRYSNLGKLSSKTIFHQNKNEHLSKRQDFIARLPNKLWREINYKYNLEGYLIKESYKNTINEDELIFTYKYDDRGNLIEKLPFPFDKGQSKIIYYYNTQNKIVKEKRVASNGSVNIITFEYDTVNNSLLIEEKGIVNKITKQKFNNNSDLISELIQQKDTYTTRIDEYLLSYINKGQLKSKKDIRNGRLTTNYYDNIGNLERRIDTNKAGLNFSEVVYIRDKIGNIIQLIYTKNEIQKIKIDWEIEYYD